MEPKPDWTRECVENVALNRAQTVGVAFVNNREKIFRFVVWLTVEDEISQSRQCVHRQCSKKECGTLFMATSFSAFLKCSTGKSGTSFKEVRGQENEPRQILSGLAAFEHDVV